MRKDIQDMFWASRRIIATTLLTVIALTGFARAQMNEMPVTLKVGDPAPALASGKWLKGEPVKAFESGKVYVIECWATWCGPCIAAIPHVTELQQKYGKDGLVVIGQNVWEHEEGLSEPFVQKMGEKMDYRVVADTAIGEEGQMAKTWLIAAGRDSIPCSFVIDRQGKLAWIGHPMLMEPILKQVLAGTFDAKKQAELEAAQEAASRKLSQLVQSGDMDGAMKQIDEMKQQYPDLAGGLEFTRFRIQLLKNKDYDAAYKTAEKVMEEFKDQPQSLNALAWTIVDAPGIEKRNLDIALKAAQRADELTQHEEPQVLDTLARVYFEKGEVAKAVEIQTKAVEHVDGNLKSELQQTLDKYKAAQSGKKAG